METDPDYDPPKRSRRWVVFVFAISGLLFLDAAASLFIFGRPLSFALLVAGLGCLVLTIWWAKRRI